MADKRTLNKKYRPVEPTGYWRCRCCGCTDRHACPGGCSWAADRLCSACTFTALEVHALLWLSCSGEDPVPAETELASYSLLELAQAGRWATDWLAWAKAASNKAGAGRPPTAPPRPQWFQKRITALDKLRRPYLYP